MLVLHHLEKSRSFRILWALEELQLDYRIQFYKRLANLSAPPELKKIHPLGKAPILQDNQLCVAESAVILEYLQENYDQHHQFQALNSQAKQQYKYWMHYAEGSLMPLLVMQLVMTEVPKKAPLLIRPVAKKITQGVKTQFIQSRLASHIDFIEQYLSEHEYFADRFTFADIQMSFPLEAIHKQLGDKRPHIQAYLQRLAHRPAYFRAQAKEQVL